MEERREDQRREEWALQYHSQTQIPSSEAAGKAFRVWELVQFLTWLDSDMGFCFIISRYTALHIFCILSTYLI